MSSFKLTGDIIRKDALAGSITGLMAIPLTIGICLMSDYPIQTGLITVVFACIVGFISFLFRPGNYVGVPGIAAGLAPVLAMGVHQFGMANMPFLIFLTSFFQMLVWKFEWERYILKAVPAFLVEGLLAGVGVKIALKFLPYTYEYEKGNSLWTTEKAHLVIVSVICILLFLYLYSKFHKKSPAIPYVVTILAGVLIAHFVKVPMLHIDHAPFKIKLPLPNIDLHHPVIIIQMIGYALMLATIDVIEQVMSNVAIEKIDPMHRSSNSNNSLMAIWIANMGSSFFGGMTNLDGLAKSTTNATAGAVTKLSNLFTGAVLLFFVFQHKYLEYLPEFSLAVLMIFSGWKMIAGLYHVASEGQYAFMLSLFCGIFVWKLGIFEGLLISLAIHGLISYVIDKHHKLPTLNILKKFFLKFIDEIPTPEMENMVVETDSVTGGKRYRTIVKPPSDKKSLTNFIQEWGKSLNNHNLLNVINHYDYDAMLWGTFAKDLNNGHIKIKKYFEHLMDLKNLKVDFNDDFEVRQYNDIFIQSGSYEFSYTKKTQQVKVPARYSFVCKKDKSSWYILEHHSSVLPE